MQYTTEIERLGVSTAVGVCTWSFRLLCGYQVLNPGGELLPAAGTLLGFGSGENRPAVPAGERLNKIIYFLCGGTSHSTRESQTATGGGSQDPPLQSQGPAGRVSFGRQDFE